MGCIFSLKCLGIIIFRVKTLYICVSMHVIDTLNRMRCVNNFTDGLTRSRFVDACKTKCNGFNRHNTIQHI